MHLIKTNNGLRNNPNGTGVMTPGASGESGSGLLKNASGEIVRRVVYRPGGSSNNAGSKV